MITSTTRITGKPIIEIGLPGIFDPCIVIIVVAVLLAPIIFLTFLLLSFFLVICIINLIVILFLIIIFLLIDLLQFFYLHDNWDRASNYRGIHGK
ncbi:hypothetical protein EWM64_g1842 [Hericium alpestre]|uniref:Uncharacterized protein n=1 Tax=Hericium alpestre TaxID=135208 RepID=A0A4Z0A6R4_9AGAM|nr:hypothetical protein EWM64_g1842 [Hericium alpestre]